MVSSRLKLRFSSQGTVWNTGMDAAGCRRGVFYYRNKSRGDIDTFIEHRQPASRLASAEKSE
jgi:hypothetical protein